MKLSFTHESVPNGKLFSSIRKKRTEIGTNFGPKIHNGRCMLPKLPNIYHVCIDQFPFYQIAIDRVKKMFFLEFYEILQKGTPKIYLNFSLFLPQTAVEGCRPWGMPSMGDAVHGGCRPWGMPSMGGCRPWGDVVHEGMSSMRGCRP